MGMELKKIKKKQLSTMKRLLIKTIRKLFTTWADVISMVME